MSATPPPPGSGYYYPPPPLRSAASTPALSFAERPESPFYGESRSGTPVPEFASPLPVPRPRRPGTPTSVTSRPLPPHQQYHQPATMQAPPPAAPATPAPVDTVSAQLDHQFEMMMRELAIETADLQQKLSGQPSTPKWAPVTPDSALPTLDAQRRPSLAPSLAPSLVPSLTRKSHQSDDSGRGSTWYSSSASSRDPTLPRTPATPALVTVDAQLGAGTDDFLAQMLGDLHDMHTQYEVESEVGRAGASPPDQIASAAEGGYAQRPASCGDLEVMERNRTKAVYELVHTEVTYVNQLATLVQLVIAPLREALATGKKGLGITADDLQTLACNVEQILGLHQTLLSGLKERYSLWTKDQKISDIFRVVLPFLKMYPVYMANYPAALSTLKRLRTPTSKHPTDAQRVFDAAEASPAFKGLTMQSFLILPVQRVPRYILLLENLTKYTQPTHPDYAGLQQCVAEVKCVADHINESIRQQEAQRKVIALQSRLTGRPAHFPTLVAPARRLLGQADFTTRASMRMAGLGIPPMLQDTRRTMFLFSDLILIAKRTADGKYDWKDEFGMDAVLVADQGDETDAGWPLQLLAADHGVELFAPARLDRDTWAHRIRSAHAALLEARAARGRTMHRVLGSTTPTSEPDMYMSGRASTSTDASSLAHSAPSSWMFPSPTSSSSRRRPSGAAAGLAVPGSPVVPPTRSRSADPRRSRSPGGSVGGEWAAPPVPRVPDEYAHHYHGQGPTSNGSHGSGSGGHYGHGGHGRGPSRDRKMSGSTKDLLKSHGF
ncbi:hypothetical protein GGF31_000006 [Allomyces arbusculus]|nr:hypothetical protein GGF31_000006 [Allomyces arbusculus]